MKVERDCNKEDHSIVMILSYPALSSTSDSSHWTVMLSVNMVVVGYMPVVVRKTSL